MAEGVLRTGEDHGSMSRGLSGSAPNVGSLGQQLCRFLTLKLLTTSYVD